MDSLHVVQHLINHKQPRVLKNKLTTITKLNIVPLQNVSASWTLSLLFLSNTMSGNQLYVCGTGLYLGCRAKLWLNLPLHTSQQIRGLGEHSRSNQPALHSCCFDTGGTPPCLSIISVSPLIQLQTFSNPHQTHTHSPAPSPYPPPAQRNSPALWTMFHFLTGHIFDSLMAPTKRN